MNDSQSGPWIELAVEVAGIDAELAADLLRQACPGGVAIEAASRLDENIDAYVLDGDAAAVVKGYMPVGDDAPRLERNVRLALQTAPLQRPPVWRDAAVLNDEDWRDSWKKYFGIQKIGKNVVVAPTWVDYKMKRGDIVLRIDPGMAFGTGQHPTTAMCLRAIEEFADGGASVLDLGCGSGILALAAAKLGAARVLAIDNDLQAVKATTENAEANDVAGIIEVREGTLDAAHGEAFNVIVANISGLTLTRLAPDLASSLRPDGRLVISGFLEDTVDALRKALTVAGLGVERVDEEGVWRAIVAVKA